MSVNTSRIDEEQKEVLKKDTLIRLFKYLLVFKKQISVVLLIMAGTIAISMATPIMMGVCHQRLCGVRRCKGTSEAGGSGRGHVSLFPGGDQDSYVHHVGRVKPGPSKYQR